jgi:hypothetical protein
MTKEQAYRISDGSLLSEVKVQKTSPLCVLLFCLWQQPCELRSLI